MFMKTRTPVVVASVAALALVLPLAAPASATVTVSDPLVTGLVGPLGLDVENNGTLYVAEAFAGRLIAVDKKGSRTVAQEEGGEIAGVDVRGGGKIAYTTTAGDEESGVTAAALKVVHKKGDAGTVADLLGYEQTQNPDQGNSYGFQDLDEGCKGTLPDFIPGDPYNGMVDAHPYSVVSVPGGWVVGDAAGNDLVKVSEKGRVSTLTVLPAQPVVITEEMAEEFGLNECVVGKTYNAEPVPTDVELGPDGMLYVSLLAGEPAPGAVYRVNPKTGAATLLASGFAGATGLAVSKDGTVYVAELFGGRISTIADGAPALVVDVPFPAALEWAKGRLYATIDIFVFEEGADEPGLGDGKVVTITP